MRIGFFRTCGLGDAVQLTPLLRQARADFPEAEIVLFVNRVVGPLFRDCPFVDRVDALPHEWFQPHPLLRKPLYAKLWGLVRREGPWDLFLTLEPRWYRNLNFWRVRAGIKAGQVTRGTPGRFLYDHWIEKTRGGRAGMRVHQSRRYLELWEKATGKTDRGWGYDLRYLPEPETPLEPPLPSRYLCFAPGSGNAFTRVDTKKWPPEYWAQLADRVMASGSTQVVWLGVEGDLDPALYKGRGVSLMGKANLLQSVSAIRHSVGLVGNDSGLFHIAMGLDVPAAAFFGPTESGFTGAFRTQRARIYEDNRLPCRPCYQETCDYEGELPEAPLERPFCQALLTPERIWPDLSGFFQIDSAAPSPPPS
ncbi:MAG: glycosyltransferase family 9 protein [Verrucomicrobiota bacterium]